MNTAKYNVLTFFLLPLYVFSFSWAELKPEKPQVDLGVIEFKIKLQEDQKHDTAFIILAFDRDSLEDYIKDHKYFAPICGYISFFKEGTLDKKIDLKEAGGISLSPYSHFLRNSLYPRISFPQNKDPLTNIVWNIHLELDVEYLVRIEACLPIDPNKLNQKPTLLFSYVSFLTPGYSRGPQTFSKQY